MKKTVYLSLGSNLGDREANLRRALEGINASGVTVTKQSSVYETAPMYRGDQPMFLNMVVEGETDVLPRVLLRRLQTLEVSLGRTRGKISQKNAPRTIDIDILFYGQFQIAAPPELIVPHPKLHERRFVLEPMVEIAPDWRHPESKKAMRELLRGLDPQGIKRLGELGNPAEA